MKHFFLHLTIIILFVICQACFFLSGKEYATTKIESIVPTLLADNFRQNLQSTSDDNFYNAQHIIPELDAKDCADQLFTRLKEELEEAYIIHSDIALRLTAPDEFHTTVESGNSLIAHPANALKSHYTLKENGTSLIVFLDYHWMDGFASLMCLTNLYITFFLIALYIIGLYILNRKVQTRFIKNPAILPVSHARTSSTRIYTLPDGSIFNAEEHLLQDKENTTKLRKQLVLLLQAFLEAPNHQLTFEEVNDLFWQKDNCADSRARIISDLRKELNKITRCHIQLIKDHGYALTSSL